jgi:phosphotransacetylase
MHRYGYAAAKLPLIPGHELAGKIRENGGAGSGFEVGDRVTINPNIPSTVHAACLSKMAERGQIKWAIVDGPLAFDNAISATAARDKGIVSPVSGDADVVVAPDLDSGNILSKNLEYLAQARVAGIVMGAKAPVVLTSRSDPPRARVFSLALASVLCHGALAQ